MCNDKLLPCPFCGGEAKLWRIGAKEPQPEYIICDTPFCVVFGGFYTEQEAVEAWNSRQERRW